MFNKKEINLLYLSKLLKNDFLLVGESIDLYKIGNKLKREELKNLGIEYYLVKKSYFRYFFKDVEYFSGSVVIVKLPQDIGLSKIGDIISILEKDLAIIPLYLLNKERVIFIKYINELIKEETKVINIIGQCNTFIKNNVYNFNKMNLSFLKLLKEYNKGLKE